MMNKILRTVVALLLVIGVAESASAKKSSFNLSGRESSGLNALNYVLQKPLGTDSFPENEKGIGKHFFIGASGGVSMLGNSFSGIPKPGVRIGGQLGTWFTPVHGIRIGGDVGRLSIHDGPQKAWFGALRADYLMNFSALLRGYDPSRKFELIGAFGVEYQRIRQNGEWGNNYGFGASLQLRYNATRSLYLFIEPRLALLSGMKYDYPYYKGDIKFDYDRFRFKNEFTFNIGLGYRILTGKMRRAFSSPFIQSGEDNMYFGAGAGLWLSPLNSMTEKNPFAEAHFGKMLSSESGIQFTLGFGQQRQWKGTQNRYMAVGSLDYVLNLNNLFGGYRPRQAFELSLNVGVAAGVLGRSDKKYGRALSPGGSFGLTGLFNLSDNWGIYIHPQAYYFRGDLNKALRYKESAPLASLEVGLRYTIGNYSRRFSDNYEDYAKAKNWFLEAGAGGAARMRGSNKIGADMYVGFGKRFTPISSWRFTVSGDAFPKYPGIIALDLNFDYLSSITTAMYGYDPDRLFDLQMVLGVNAGIGSVQEKFEKPAIGLKGGLQFNFRLNQHLDLFAEPTFVARQIPSVSRSNSWTPVVHANLGLRYKLGTTSGKSGGLSESILADGQNFAGFSLAPSLFSKGNSFSQIRPSGVFDLYVGRWFSTSSALRLVYGSTLANLPNKKFDRTYLYIASLRLDYMLNFTSLFDKNPERKFHILGVVGAGGAVSPEKHSKLYLTTYGGAQFRFNLPSNLDLHIEPGIDFWANRTIGDSKYRSRSRYVISGKGAIGLSYRF